MKMGKEFNELLNVANKAETRSLKLMVASDIETIMQDYPENGYKWRRAKKVVDKLRNEYETMRKEHKR